MPASNWFLFFGRLHPLLVHAPIGFLMLLAVIELAGRTRRFHTIGHARGLILALTVGASLATVTCGLLLSTDGGYDPHLLAWHKWTGIALAVSVCCAGVAFWRKRHLLYSGLLMLTLAIMGPASHFGGSITHGKTYLTEYAPQWVRSILGEPKLRRVIKIKPADPQQFVVYEDLVDPVLQKNCFACHNSDKLSGQFRVDTLDFLKKGGSNGPVLAASARSSVLIQRMLLPQDDPKHMPPAGKPQPTDDQIALIQWWIDSGAPADKKVADLEPTGRVSEILASMAGEDTSLTAVPASSESLREPVWRLTSELGVVITPIAPSEPWLSCNASHAAHFGDAELARLAPLGNNLVSLDLSGSQVTDGGLASIAAMANLKRLRLERTAVTDQGLLPLSKLRKLEYLNLYRTAVTNAGLTTLKRLPQLHHLFLWQTKVTPEAARMFADQMVDQHKIQRWQQQIEELQARIKSQGIEVVQGTQSVLVAASQPAPASPATQTALINSVCPVSGKPVDPTQTVEYLGKRIGFCCDKCPALFQKNPADYVAKLNLN